MAYDRSQVTDWMNEAPPTELIAHAKQLLAKIGTLPPDQREQFSREISDNPAISKLFTASV